MAKVENMNEQSKRSKAARNAMLTAGNKVAEKVT
jgi:hypothetical protein